MNINKIFLLFLISVLGLRLSAQDVAITKEKFKVWGNCDMCKSTIEKSVKSVDGVSMAKWNTSSKIMQVKFDANKTSLKDIQSSIAASGYDIEGLKAPDEAYNKLHDCCKYDRE